MDRVYKEERNHILGMVKKIKATGCNVLLIQKSILRDAVTDLSLHYLVSLQRAGAGLHTVNLLSCLAALEACLSASCSLLLSSAVSVTLGSAALPSCSLPAAAYQ